MSYRRNVFVERRFVKRRFVSLEVLPDQEMFAKPEIDKRSASPQIRPMHIGSTTECGQASRNAFIKGLVMEYRFKRLRKCPEFPETGLEVSVFDKIITGSESHP